MELSRGKSILKFSCTWCCKTVKVALHLPRPETVYIPQIRVETSDADKIIAMYGALIKVLDGVTSSSPMVTKETYPELCKSREKYFVAPINLLQSVGFERLDGIYCIQQVDEVTRRHAADMRNEIQKEIDVLVKTKGDPERSSAWLPWQVDAVTSRISWYADNVFICINGYEQEFKEGNITPTLLEDSSKAWAWCAAYWYFEYYSIIRSEHRQHATQLLNTATKVVCEIAEALWAAGHPLQHGEGYFPKDPASLWYPIIADCSTRGPFDDPTLVHSTPSSIPSTLTCLYKIGYVRNMVLKNEPKLTEGSKGKLYNVVRNLYGFMKGSSASEYDASYIVDLCKGRNWGPKELIDILVGDLKRVSVHKLQTVESLCRVAMRSTADVLIYTVPWSLWEEHTIRGMEIGSQTEGCLEKIDRFDADGSPSRLAAQLGLTYDAMSGTLDAAQAEAFRTVLAALSETSVSPLLSLQSALSSSLFSSSGSFRLSSATVLSRSSPYSFIYPSDGSEPRFLSGVDPIGVQTPPNGAACNSDVILVFERNGSGSRFCGDDTVVPDDVQRRIAEGG
eukprot:TRINITY_DN18802_c0_g1_i1.p1 TRINITY_DN18802_c0_g1~~TRINITY_DN18802_c0_g1_i1.p1  ORF type:complete len:615 (+),score=73.24 TRINITY_DN18802_c0_g1_i1:155-1846(+)